MGIADRDYYRSTGRHAGAPSGTFSRAKLGRVSVTTWLIVINVAVFLVNNVILSGTVTATPAGKVWLPGVTQEQIDNARPAPLPAVTRDGFEYYRMFDPGPPPVLIGQQRFITMPPLSAYGHFSTGKVWIDGQVWRLLTFQFLHAGIWHIFLNMFALFMFGGLVEGYLGRRRYLLFYLLCGAGGALLYMLLNLVGFISGADIPFLLFHYPYVPLVGASAGVFGVLAAAAVIAPNSIVYLILPPIPLKLKWVVLGYLGISVYVLYVQGHNAGGEAAHLGGALVGYMLIRRADLLWDFLHAISLGGARNPPRSPRRPTAIGNAPPPDIDAILDKVHHSGLGSLTERERQALRDASAGRRP